MKQTLYQSILSNSLVSALYLKYNEVNLMICCTVYHTLLRYFYFFVYLPKTIWIAISCELSALHVGRKIIECLRCNFPVRVTSIRLSYFARRGVLQATEKFFIPYTGR